MTTIRAAFGLLTRFPVSNADSLSGAAAYGLVGAALGCAASLPLLIVGGVAPLAAGALAITVAAFVSGALHLDGLADTADALAAPDPMRAEEAREDPRIGAAGAVAVATVILVDASLIAALIDLAGVPRAALALVIALAGSRAAAAASVPLARGRVRETASGGWFAARTDRVAAIVAVGTAVAIAIGGAAAMGNAGLIAGLGLGLVAAALAGEWLIRRRGGLDGDGIGAIVEVTFGAILLFELLMLTAGGLGR